MRTLTSSLAIAALLSAAAVPTADAWVGSSLKASVTKYDIRAAAKAKRSTPKKTARPASIELPEAAKGGLVFGDPDAPTTIVMFTDIECPFCKRFHEQTYPSIKKDYLDAKKARFVIRHFPLSFHPNAGAAAKAVVCARAQGDDKARTLYGKLVGLQKMSAAGIANAVNAIDGIDLKAMTTCVSADSTKKTIDDDIAAGTALKVAGTPSFLIIGPSGATKQITGAYPYASFSEALDAVAK